MLQQPVYAFAKWQVKEGQLETVLQLLPEVALKSRAEQGNLFYKIHQNAADVNSIILFEGYVNQAAVETHRNTDHFKTLVIGTIVPCLAHREVILASELFPAE